MIVKVCGVRRPSDAEIAVELGARYVGCVLAADSPRRATLDQARAVRDAVHGAAELVLVFRGAAGAEVEASADLLDVRRVQVHGAGPSVAAELERAGLRVHRVFRIEPDESALPTIEPTPSADCPAVLDVGRGGSGRAFDWSLLDSGAPAATLIAGGIGPDNVRELLSKSPFGIDVSSGVESAPGIKDRGRLTELFAAVQEWA